LTAGEVIGRDDELDVIEAFLDRIADGPAVLVLEGESGMGKTILWEAGLERSGARGCRVLSCRGAEAEASFAFAGLSELLADVLEDAAPTLAPPRRRALEVALLLAEPGDVVPDLLAIGLAVLDVLKGLAEPVPLLLAADDLQWLDASSAAVLQVALRRLSTERVGLLATAREGQGGPPLELERSLPHDRVERMPLAALSLSALHRLLRNRLDLDLRRPALARVHAASGGNPFFALELGRELVRLGAPQHVDRTLHVPRNLHEVLGGRLGRLPEQTLDVLVRASALARPTADLLGSRDEVAAALSDAVKEGVVELDGSHVRFAHPLLASICYEQASAERRRDVHRALADVVPEVGERARHLALAAEGPDERVAAELDSAVEEAARRGATADAAELAELAADLTREEASRRQRRLAAAKYHRFAGGLDRTMTILDQLLEEVPSGTERADLLLAVASTLTTLDLRTMIGICDEALAEAGTDGTRCALILAYRSVFRLFSVDVTGALADARAALQEAERAGDPALVAAAIGRVGQAEMWAVQITPGLLERGTELEVGLDLALDRLESPRLYLSRLKMRRGDLDAARADLEELESHAAGRGDEPSRVYLLWTLSMLEWLAGRWAKALDHFASAHELAEQTHPLAPAWVGRVRALIEADRGLVDEARASAEAGLAFSRSISNDFFTIMSLASLGRLELALGNLEEAARHLRDLPARLAAGGMRDPVKPLWADAIETLVALGDLETARGYLEPYQTNAERLGSPWALASASRCQGLYAAAQGDVEAALAALEQSLAQLEGLSFPFERARSLLALGAVRRQAQQKRAARETLDQALEAFETLPAPLWAEKARAELRRISGRQPATAEGLTETEARVAALAARGSSNREIAAELFMGLSTVEMHLSRVYRKLGIRSRAALGTRLAITRDEAAQP
jgi:DNA-binding CsgD family transcriptional regulator